MKKLLVIAILALTLSSCMESNLAGILKARMGWDASYIYKAGEYTKKSDWVYQSLQDNNVGHDPDLEPLYAPTWWKAQ